MKILYVPNEWGVGRQHGMRRAFGALLDEGLLEDVKIYSLLWRLRQGQGQSARLGLLQLVKDFQPDLILMQHLGSTGLDAAYFSEMRALSDFRLIYHEADPYSRWIHPLPDEARAAGKSADVVFTVGSDIFRKNFSRHGARDVRWCSSVYDPGRFGRTPIPYHHEREFDVVMVANRTKARTPFTGHPHSRQRVELVERLTERFGRRFAIYGSGWSGPSARGPITYDRQDAAIHSGWLSANWDHYATEASYFSDRLPTTLATGSVHLTTWHQGFDEIFPTDAGFVRFGRSPRQLVDLAEEILQDLDPQEMYRKAQRARKFANSNFRQDDQLVSMINYDEKLVNGFNASLVWERNQRSLTEL